MLVKIAGLKFSVTRITTRTVVYIRFRHLFFQNLGFDPKQQRTFMCFGVGNHYEKKKPLLIRFAKFINIMQFLHKGRHDQMCRIF